MKPYESYPWWWIVGQNLLFVLYFAVGYFVMSPLKISGFPLVSVTYVLFLYVMLVFVLRKHLCTHCYYYGKWCSTGWGKLSSLLFKEKSGDYELGVKLAGITWGIGTLLPIVLGILAIVINKRVLLLWILFMMLTPPVIYFHKVSCKTCKMREKCPASMTRKSS